MNTERYGPTKRPAALRRALQKLYCTVLFIIAPCRAALHMQRREILAEKVYLSRRRIFLALLSVGSLGAAPLLCLH